MLYHPPKRGEREPRPSYTWLLRLVMIATGIALGIIAADFVAASLRILFG